MKKFLIAISAILFLFSCEEGSKNEVQDSEQSVDTTLTVEDDIAWQISLLNDKIVEEPDNSNHYLQRAELKVKQGNLQEAKADLSRCLQIDSTVASFHYRLGELQFLTKEVEASLSSFKKTIELAETHTGAMLKVSEIDMLLGNYKTAIENIDKALKIEKFNPQAYYMKGFTFLQAKDTTRAVSSFRTALDLNSDFYEPNLLLGLIFEDQHDPIAKAYYDACIDIRPQAVEGYYNKAKFMQDHEEEDQALLVYDQLLEIEPNFATAHYNKGFIHMVSKEDYQEAIKHFTQAVTVNEIYYQAFYNRGLCYEKIGNNASALLDYQKSLVLKRDYTLAAEGINRVK